LTSFNAVAVYAEGSELRVLPLRVSLRSETLAQDFFAGPLWRSGLGLALQRHFPDVFELLFAEHARLGRLYALQPPAGPVRPGEVFELGLRLMGPACEHALACIAALVQLGEMGLGQGRGRFSLLSARVAVEGMVPFMEGDRGLLAWPRAMAARHWLDHSAGQVRRVRIELLKPLRIKEGNAACLGPLAFSTLVRRLYGRLAQLCEAAGEVHPLTRETTARQLEAAASVRLVESTLERVTVRRKSSRSRQTMKVEGVTGQMVYEGELSQFAGLLALGQVLQLGGKTSFGFGLFRAHFSFED